MIKAYAFAVISFVIALLAGVASFFRVQSIKKTLEMKEIEVNSAKEAARRLARAQKADHDAAKKHRRKTDHEIKRARRGNRDYFE